MSDFSKFAVALQTFGLNCTQNKAVDYTCRLPSKRVQFEIDCRLPSSDYHPPVDYHPPIEWMGPLLEFLHLMDPFVSQKLGGFHWCFWSIAVVALAPLAPVGLFLLGCFGSREAAITWPQLNCCLVGGYV